MTTYARFGNYCYQILTTDTQQGIGLTLTALSNAAHFVSLYSAFVTMTTLEISLDGGANWNAITGYLNRSGFWERGGVEVPAAQCNGSTSLLIRTSTMPLP